MMSAANGGAGQGTARTPSLVLLRGPHDDVADWRATTDALADRFRVLVSHLVGTEPQRTVSPGEDAGALATQLDTARSGPIYLCGHGYGGLVALAFAVTYPERLLGLVLVDTTPEPLLATGAAFATASAANDPTTLVAAAARGSQGFMDKLEFITTPTLVVAGEADAPFLQRGAELLHGWMPFSRLVRIANAAHRPQVENPAAFVAELAAFLSEMEAARAI